MCILCTCLCQFVLDFKFQWQSQGYAAVVVKTEVVVKSMDEE